MLKRVARIFRMLRHARIKWRRPADCDIVLYDATGLEILAPLLRPWRVQILHMRGEEINLPIYLAAQFAGGKRRTAYATRFVRAARPKLVVTLMDNNLDFYEVSPNCPGVTTMFIQNGYRSYYIDAFEHLDNRLSNVLLRVDYMMTFGHRIGAEYAKHIAGRAITMGSLKNNMIARSRQSDPDVITFIAQYRHEKGFHLKGRTLSVAAFIGDTDRIILPFLRDYAARNGKRLLIVTGSDEDMAARKAYYDAILGTAGDYPEWHDYASSYEAADGAGVTVAVDSSLGYESAARGNRTAFFCIRGHFLDLEDRRFGWPAQTADEGPFWANRPDHDAFERILDRLFAMTDDEWQTTLLQHGFSDHMAYDPGNSILPDTIGAIMTGREENIPPATSAGTEGFD